MVAVNRWRDMSNCLPLSSPLVLILDLEAGRWASDQAIANMISPMPIQCPRFFSGRGQGYPAHQTLGQSWTPRTSAAACGRPKLLQYELRYIRTFSNGVYTHIRSPASISSTNGPIGSQRWCGAAGPAIVPVNWRCHLSVHLIGHYYWAFQLGLQFIDSPQRLYDYVSITWSLGDAS